MPFLLFQRSAAQDNTLIEEDVISDFSCFADYHTHSVVDKKAPANRGARVDFNAGEKSVKVGDAASEGTGTGAPEEMGGAVQPDGVEARVAEQNFNDVAGGRVPAENTLNIFSRLTIPA